MFLKNFLKNFLKMHSLKICVRVMHQGALKTGIYGTINLSGRRWHVLRLCNRWAPILKLVVSVQKFAGSIPCSLSRGSCKTLKMRILCIATSFSLQKFFLEVFIFLMAKSRRCAITKEIALVPQFKITVNLRIFRCGFSKAA